LYLCHKGIKDNDCFLFYHQNIYTRIRNIQISLIMYLYTYYNNTIIISNLVL
jgi:hypothetical protein